MSTVDPRVAKTQAHGYKAVRIINDQLVGYLPMAFTLAIVVGINDDGGYSHRYCYSEFSDMLHALLHWDGTGHPSGPWIVRKGGGQQDIYGPGAKK